MTERERLIRELTEKAVRHQGIRAAWPMATIYAFETGVRIGASDAFDALIGMLTTEDAEMHLDNGLDGWAGPHATAAWLESKLSREEADE